MIFFFGINKDNGRFLLRNNVKGEMGVILRNRNRIGAVSLETFWTLI